MHNTPPTRRPQAQPRWLLLVVLLAAAMLAAPLAAEERKLLVAHADDPVQRNSHAIGFTGDVQLGFLGFAYRKYLGSHAVEFTALPLLADGGDYLAISVGARYIHYPLVWRGSGSGSFFGSATALRLVAGAGMHFSRDDQPDIEIPAENCTTGICEAINNSRGGVNWRSQFAGGFGFEFGALQRSGFSLAVDLMMTAFFDKVGFDGAYPLPYATLAYSW